MMPKIPFSVFGGFLLLGALQTGCGMLPAKDHKPEPVVARVLPPPTPRTDGAIYQAGQQMELFADLKARRVGDVLTIVLNESTNAAKTAVTKTAKTTTVANSAPTVFGQSVTIHGAPLLSTTLNGANSFDGEGSSAQSNSLAGSHNNLGELLSNTGNSPEAEAEYRKALAIQQKLVEDNGDRKSVV